MTEEKGAPPGPSPEPEAGAAAAGEAETLRAALAAEREKAERLTEQFRRLAADFDNFRKRKERDVEDARAQAREEVVARLLDVLSNFDRALESHGDEEALHQGVTLIFRQFRGALEALGVRRIDAQGHAFDPALHEAVLREETTGYADGTVIAELEKGYTLHGRVLRPARVKVAVRPAPPPPDAKDAGDEGDDVG